jgi:hypothetical protein
MLLSRNVGAGDESPMAWSIGRGGRGDPIRAWGRRGGENGAFVGRLAKTHGQTAIIPHPYHEMKAPHPDPEYQVENETEEQLAPVSIIRYPHARQQRQKRSRYLSFGRVA